MNEQALPAHGPVLTRNSLNRVSMIQPSVVFMTTYLAVHALLGWAAQDGSQLVALHVIVTFGVGMWWAVRGQLGYVACCGIYMMASEVFWRMNDAPVPWEFGKYSISCVFLTALVCSRRISGPILPLLYFAALLPALWDTVNGVDPATARDLVSFNLSGPFVLLVSAWFYSHVRFTVRDSLFSFLAVVGPVLAITVVAIKNTLSVENLVFSGESNAVTSGGFGPNQVSSVMGLGTLAGLFYILYTGRGWFQKMLMSLLVIVFVFQSALTFSRSGLAMAFGAGIMAGVFLLHNARARLTLLGAAAVLAFFVTTIVIPTLNDITGNAFEERFSSTTSTGRGDIARDELQFFLDHPYMGVGVGMASVYREQITGQRVAAHTEFTRMVGEHGMLGWFALVFLLAGGAWNVYRAPSSRERAVIAALITWAVLFLLVNAFRLAAPGVVLGVTFASFRLNDTWRVRIYGLGVSPTAATGWAE